MIDYLLSLLSKLAQCRKVIVFQIYIIYINKLLLFNLWLYIKTVHRSDAIDKKEKRHLENKLPIVQTIKYTERWAQQKYIKGFQYNKKKII